jgi:hypothetical protein
MPFRSAQWRVSYNVIVAALDFFVSARPWVLILFGFNLKVPYFLILSNRVPC